MKLYEIAYDDKDVLAEGKIKDIVKAGIATAAMMSAAGCAPSMPITYTDAAQAQYVYGHQQQFDGAGVITVTRDKAFQGSGCLKSVYINGDLVARLDQGETVTLYLDPGEHVMSATLDGKGLCAAKTKKAGTLMRHQMAEREVDIEAGAQENYRLTIGTNGDEGIARTAF